MRWPYFQIAIFLPGILAFASLCSAQTVASPTPRDSSSIRLALKNKSSPRSVMLRSLIVPGWGQYYNRQYIKAALAFVAETGLIVTAIYWNQRAIDAANRYERLFYRLRPIPTTFQFGSIEVINRDEQLFYQNNRNTANWFLLGTVLLSMLDAYVDASLADFDESPDLSLRLSPQLGSHSNGVMLTIKIGL